MLEIYTVYENPTDYPGKFVVRLWRVGKTPVPDHEPLAVVDTLEQARKAIPWGLHRMNRLPDDDPVIVETWF